MMALLMPDGHEYNAAVNKPCLRNAVPTITLASNVFLMPGNAAWYPLTLMGTLEHAPQGVWQATSDEHIVIWCWDDLIDHDCRCHWSLLDDSSRKLAIDEWLQALLAPMRREVGDGLMLIGGCFVHANALSGPVYEWQTEFEQAFTRQLEAHDFHALHLDHWLAEKGRSQCVDSRNRYLFSCPFSMSGLASLASWIAARLQALRAPARKVLVLDCDNTLWGGVIGEEGLHGLKLGQDGVGKLFQAFQRAADYWYQRGVLLALCSKNHPDDVWQVFEHHAAMCLGRAHIAASAISWESKSAGLVHIAQQLNLGLDALLFWDDSPTERAEVRANCPQVEVVEPPTEIWSWPDALLTHPSLRSRTLTREDVLRQHSYQALKESEAWRQQSRSDSDFLASLQLQAGLHPLGPDNLGRAEQLALKTNQFNLSCQRYDKAALQHIAATGQVWLASLTDRFADHGLVGLCIVRPIDKHCALLDSLALSCRVLSRGMEYWLLAQIIAELRKVGVTRLLIAASHCERNQPAWQWLLTLPVVEVPNPDPAVFSQQHFLAMSLDDAVTLPCLEYYHHV